MRSDLRADIGLLRAVADQLGPDLLAEFVHVEEQGEGVDACAGGQKCSDLLSLSFSIQQLSTYASLLSLRFSLGGGNSNSTRRRNAARGASAGGGAFGDGLIGRRLRRDLEGRVGRAHDEHCQTTIRQEGEEKCVERNSRHR